MSPIVQQLHSPSGSVFSMFIAELTSVLQSLNVHEVRLGDVNSVLALLDLLLVCLIDSSDGTPVLQIQKGSMYSFVHATYKRTLWVAS